jgi:hypothetical protein
VPVPQPATAGILVSGAAWLGSVLGRPVEAVRARDSGAFNSRTWFVRAYGEGVPERVVVKWTIDAAWAAAAAGRAEVSFYRYVGGLPDRERDLLAYYAARLGIAGHDLAGDYRGRW